MSESPQENTVFSGTQRAAMRWITLPDDLARWVDQNRELVERVQNALTDTYDMLTEEQIWETVAASCSPEWQDARTNLHAAEQQWQKINSPENTPLGLIGKALDSHETNSASEHFAFSLAHFTVVNEGLRQREDLGRLLSVLLVQKRMLDLSTERTQNLQKAADTLAAMDMAVEEKSARKSFREVARKIFTPKTLQAPKSVPAPSSLKT